MNVFEAFAKSVYGLCYYYVKNEQDADDIVMECFEAYYKKSKKEVINNPRAWLLETARRKSLEVIRNRIREKKAQDEIFSHHMMESGENSHIYDDKLLETMTDGISELKPNQRDCIRLFYLAGKSYNEVGSILNLDTNKVKSAIQNGKRNLKNFITKRVKFTPERE